MAVDLNRTKERPWKLKTPPVTSEFTIHVEDRDGTVEAWGRSPSNPIGGGYGLKKGLRGRFGVYIPPLVEELGRCELEHNAKNNRMRAK